MNRCDTPSERTQLGTSDCRPARGGWQRASPCSRGDEAREPSMQRVAWRPREPAGPNVSECGAGLERIRAVADPADIWRRFPRSEIR